MREVATSAAALRAVHHHGGTAHGGGGVVVVSTTFQQHTVLGPPGVVERVDLQVRTLAGNGPLVDLSVAAPVAGPSGRPTMQRTARLAKLAAFGAAMVVIGSISGAYASHQFSDVPGSSPFHTAIDHVARAGITEGYADGGFHPTDGVSRQQLAAFLDRGLTRVAFDHGAEWGVAPADPITTVAKLSIRAGASGSGSGFVVLTADFQASPQNPEISSPLFTTWRLSERTGPTSAFTFGQTDLASLSDVDNTSREYATGSLSTVVPIAAGETKDIEVTVDVKSAARDFDVQADLTAVYVPFGWNGGGTLTKPIIIGPVGG